jgi:hypothetical protein
VYGEPSDAWRKCTHHITHSVFAYEPGQTELLEQIVPRFTVLQVYQAILSSQASEHAARMMAMRNATDNATELLGDLQLQYNKARQQIITNEMLDIAGGAEARITRECSSRFVKRFWRIGWSNQQDVLSKFKEVWLMLNFPMEAFRKFMKRLKLCWRTTRCWF